MMRCVLFVVIAFLAGTSDGGAIPDVFIGGRFIGPIIPAHPVFGANLTGAVLDPENWERNRFPGDWDDETALAGGLVRRMTTLPVLFGAVPDSVAAHSEDGRLREIVITYLDAGAFFGFKFGGEKTHADREAGDELRSRFSHHYHLISRDLKDRLEKGCGPGEQVVVGRSDLLRTVFTDYRWEDFVIRLARRDGHSIVLRLVRVGEVEGSFFDETVAALSSAERRSRLAGNVSSNERGDRLIGGIPMDTQGFTPFCGIHTLAMAGRYYGLRMRADDLAAGAAFRNTGSARGSRVLDLYRAVGEEMEMKVNVSSRFDFDRVRRAVEAGRPVIVWRRVSREREQAHSAVAARLAKDPLRALPEPTRADRAAWPDRSRKRSPSHASIVSGVNFDRNEVIFTDPWGEESRNRRMRTEEMEATSYAVFFFEI